MRQTREARQIFQMQCEICKAMAHALRLEIVERLCRREMSAADLLKALETSKAGLSKHMAILVQAGIVAQRKEGRQAYYSLAHPQIHRACSIMRSILYRRLRKGQRLLSALRLPRTRGPLALN